LNYSENKFKNIRLVQIKGIYLQPLSTESHLGSRKAEKVKRQKKGPEIKD